MIPPFEHGIPRHRVLRMRYAQFLRLQHRLFWSYTWADAETLRMLLVACDDSLYWSASYRRLTAFTQTVANTIQMFSFHDAFIVSSLLTMRSRFFYLAQIERLTKHEPVFSVETLLDRLEQTYRAALFIIDLPPIVKRCLYPLYKRIIAVVVHA